MLGGGLVFASIAECGPHEARCYTGNRAVEGT